jgi:prepilin-type N-terminal cleavage/methylation domain-containing protein
MKNYCFSQTGMTLLETIISVAIFSVVGTILVAIFSFSTKAWLKISETVELKNSGNLILSRLENELSASNISSVEVIVYPEKTDNSAISFLSASNGDYQAAPDSSGQIQWKKFIIFYLEPDTKFSQDGYYQLCSKEVSLGDYTSSTDKNPLKDLPFPPLEGKSTTYPVISYIKNYIAVENSELYITRPRYIARYITGLGFTVNSERKKVDLCFNIGKPSNNNNELALEKMEIKSTITLRN